MSQQPPVTECWMPATVDVSPAGSAVGGVLEGGWNESLAVAPPEMRPAPTVGDTQMPEAGCVAALCPPAATETPQPPRGQRSRGQAENHRRCSYRHTRERLAAPKPPPSPQASAGGARELSPVRLRSTVKARRSPANAHAPARVLGDGMRHQPVARPSQATHPNGGQAHDRQKGVGVHHEPEVPVRGRPHSPGRPAERAPQTRSAA